MVAEPEDPDEQAYLHRWPGIITQMPGRYTSMRDRIQKDVAIIAVLPLVMI
jgi:hypothetical protein